jgi:hypothetical protein
MAADFSPEQDEVLRLAWAAGFLDGEGCFTLVRHKDASNPLYRLPFVGAAQLRLDPLERLVEILGGKITYCHSNSIGKRVNQWKLRSYEIADAVPRVIPFLVMKKREAEIVLEFKSMVFRRGRGHHYSEEEQSRRAALIHEMDTIRGRLRIV